MSLLTYMNRKMTAGSQSSYIHGYLLVGIPVGYGSTEILKMTVIYGWEKYNFSVGNLMSSLIFNGLIALPFIINYIRNRKKYKSILKKIEDKSIKSYKVKAVFDYDNFEKGKLYTFQVLEDDTELTISNWKKITNNFVKMFPKKDRNILLVSDDQNSIHLLKNIINKFELDDIKEERMRKLKKLKKRW